MKHLRSPSAYDAPSSTQLRAARRAALTQLAAWRALSLLWRASFQSGGRLWCAPPTCTVLRDSVLTQCPAAAFNSKQRSRPLSVCVIFATRSLCVLVQENVLVLLILSADCGKCRKDSAKKYDFRGLGLIFLPTLTSTALYLAPDCLVCALRAQSLLSHCTVHLFLSLMMCIILFLFVVQISALDV